MVATRRKLSARTVEVLGLGPKGLYRDHAVGCMDPVGCDPAGLASASCDVGEALHRLAYSDPKSAGALPRVQPWYTATGRLIRGPQ